MVKSSPKWGEPTGGSLANDPLEPTWTAKPVLQKDTGNSQILGITITVVFFAMYEWWRWYFQTPPQPLSVTAAALLAVGYSMYKFTTIRKRFRNLRLGLQGEKAVGQYLERLRGQGYRVFHDIVGDNFNIDHVVVSSKGIFIIETKTYSKPVRGQAIVKYDGERILVNGFEPERNVVTQVRALASWLNELLIETTDRRFPIKCVIVLPGWFIEMETKNKSEVWVLNPKALPTFIENEPVRLEPEDIALISSRITTYMQGID